MDIIKCEEKTKEYLNCKNCCRYCNVKCFNECVNSKSYVFEFNKKNCIYEISRGVK